MASTYYTVSVRNAGAPVTGLTPTWSLFKKVSDKTDIVSHPSIDEVGLGIYRFAYDPSTAEAVGQIDAGSSVPSAGDRYVDVLLTNDSSGNLAVGSLPAIPGNWITASGVAANALNGKGDWPTASAVVSALTSTAVAFRAQDGVSSPTVMDALSGAWASAFSKWTFTVDAGVNHWTTFAPDRSTQVRQFVLDSPTSPTYRQ